MVTVQSLRDVPGGAINREARSPSSCVAVSGFFLSLSPPPSMFHDNKLYILVPPHSPDILPSPKHKTHLSSGLSLHKDFLL